MADYEISLGLCLKSIAIDTYEPDANMMYGLGLLLQEILLQPFDGFSIASASASSCVLLHLMQWLLFFLIVYVLLEALNLCCEKSLL
jgi:hypothetical protein